MKSRTGNVCECSHPLEDGRWESPEEVVARMHLVIELPRTKPEPVKSVKQGAGAIRRTMTVDEKRKATQQHREQLAAMKPAPVTKSVPARTARVESVGEQVAAPVQKAWGPKPGEVDDFEAATGTPSPQQKKVASGGQVIECTKEMAVQMMLLMAESGLDKQVCFRIIE